MMSPACVRALLWVYAIAEPLPKTAEFIVDELIGDGLIRPRQERMNPDCEYEVTERGQVYVEALCAVPLPVQRWVIPSAGDR